MDDTSYEAASQLFLLRDFSKSLELLLGSGLSANVKPYLLYLTLCDRAFIEPDTTDWPFNDPERKKLRKAVLKSTIWSEIQDQWELATEPVPSAIITTGFRLASKHQSDPEPITAFIETYMSRNPLPRNVFLAFVTDVLVKLQHDFYYARELVKSQLQDDEAVQTRILGLIDQEEADYTTQKLAETERLQELERKRVELAIAEAEQAEKQRKEAESLTAQPEDGSIVGRENGDNMAIAKDNVSRRKRDHSRMPLTQLWRKWVHDFVRGQGIYNAMILLFFLLAIGSNNRMRVYLNRGSRWIWQTIKSSLKMGLNVTYL